MVSPLEQARDEVEWSEALDRVHGPWLRLRLALVSAFLELEGADVLGRLEAATGEIERVPLTLLPAPAHGAARYAVEMLGSVSSGVVAALRRRKRLDLGLLETLIEDIAIIELCWFTLAGPERPRPDVAEAAAWEAYSRVRPLRASLVRFGLDTKRLPTEAPQEAVERARRLLERVARGWTADEEAAVVGSRLPDDVIPG